MLPGIPLGHQCQQPPNSQHSIFQTGSIFFVLVILPFLFWSLSTIILWVTIRERCKFLTESLLVTWDPNHHNSRAASLGKQCGRKWGWLRILARPWEERGGWRGAIVKTTWSIWVTPHEPAPVPCLQAHDTLRVFWVSPTLLESRVSLQQAGEARLSSHALRWGHWSTSRL